MVGPSSVSEDQLDALAERDALARAGIDFEDPSALNFSDPEVLAVLQEAGQSFSDPEFTEDAQQISDFFANGCEV